MPRKPTGRGRGRPPGSGQLGEEGVGHIRLTVRLPKELYDALEAVAEREHYTREAPELARTVRTALEHYVACPHRRQTGNAPDTSFAYNGQTENILEPLGENIERTTIVQGSLEGNTGQTEIVPEAEHTAAEPRDEKRQTGNVPGPLGDNRRQTENNMPAYDTSKFYLGKLCPHGHRYPGTDQSLRRIGKGDCHACDVERKRQRRQRTYQAQPA